MNETITMHALLRGHLAAVTDRLRRDEVAVLEVAATRLACGHKAYSELSVNADERDSAPRPPTSCATRSCTSVPNSYVRRTR